MRRSPTRLLLTCAAIGVAGGIVFILEGLVSGTVAALLPFLYGATLGVYFLPGAIAIALLRIPGVGLLSATLAGVVVSPFTSISFRAIGAAALIGLLQELPYALTLYRRRPVWLLYLGAVLAGVVLGVVVYLAFDVASLAVWTQAVAWFASIASPVLFTAIGHAVARGVRRTGVVRGLSAAPEPAATAGK
jgi:energy-coupling factor transport system substrate-specific component